MRARVMVRSGVGSQRVSARCVSSRAGERWSSAESARDGLRRRSSPRRGRGARSFRARQVPWCDRLGRPGSLGAPSRASRARPRGNSGGVGAPCGITERRAGRAKPDVGSEYREEGSEDANHLLRRADACCLRREPTDRCMEVWGGRGCSGSARVAYQHPCQVRCILQEPGRERRQGPPRRGPRGGAERPDALRELRIEARVDRGEPEVPLSRGRVRLQHAGDRLGFLKEDVDRDGELHGWYGVFPRVSLFLHCHGDLTCGGRQAGPFRCQESSCQARFSGSLRCAGSRRGSRLAPGLSAAPGACPHGTPAGSCSRPGATRKPASGCCTARRDSKATSLASDVTPHAPSNLTPRGAPPTAAGDPISAS